MIVDLIIILVVLVFMFICRKRGLIISIFSIFSIIISIVLAMHLYNPVENYLKENTNIENQIKITIREKIENSSENNIDESKKNNKENNINNENKSDYQEEIKNTDTKNNIDSEKLSKSVTNINNVINNYFSQGIDKIEEVKEETIEKTTNEITENVMKVISFIIVYILVTIILLILKIVLKIFTKLPVINKIDKFGGTILGFIEGAMIVYIAISIISIIEPNSKSGKLSQAISSSYIGNYIYDNNIIKNNLSNANKNT